MSRHRPIGAALTGRMNRVPDPDAPLKDSAPLFVAGTEERPEAIAAID